MELPIFIDVVNLATAASLAYLHLKPLQHSASRVGFCLTVAANLQWAIAIARLISFSSFYTRVKPVYSWIPLVAIQFNISFINYTLINRGFNS